MFLNLDLENQRIEVFSKLINEYSNIFDFNMISPKFLMKTTTDLLSEMVHLKQTYSKVDQLLKQIQEEQQKQQNIFDSFKQFAQEQLKKENDKLNESFQNLKKIENEQQKQQDLTDSFKQFAQEELKKESSKLDQSFQKLKDTIVNENNKSKDENLRNINEIKSLVDQNNNKMNSFITKDVFFILNLMSFSFLLFDLVLYQFFIKFQLYFSLIIFVSFNSCSFIYKFSLFYLIFYTISSYNIYAILKFICFCNFI